MIKFIPTILFLIINFLSLGQDCVQEFNKLYDKDKLEEALELSENCPDLLSIDSLKIRVGNCHMQGSNFKDAEETYLEVLSRDSLNTQLLNSYAAAIHRQKRYEEAIAWYTKVIELEEDHEYGQFNRGMVYYELDNYDSAEFDLLQYLEHYPKDASAYALLGDVYWQDSLNDKAIGVYTTALSFDEMNEVALYGRANCYLENELYEKALVDIKKAIRVDKDDADNILTLAEVYFLMDDDHFKQAEKAYIKSIDLDQDAYSYYRLAVCYDYQYKYALAKEAIEASLELNETPEKYGELAYYCLQLDEYEQGFVEIDRAINLDTLSDYYPYLKASLFAAVDDFENAVVFYNKAISIEDSEAIYYHDRGWTYSELGNEARALEDYEISILLDPSADTYYNRGVIYMNRKDYDLAIKEFDKAVVLNPVFIDAYFNMGLCYSNQDRMYKFCVNMRKAANLGDQEAKDYLKSYCK